MAPNRFANDTVALTDEFGTLALGDRVAVLALDAQPPFTIGVVGKWGAGKSSVLRRAFITLGGKPLEQAAPLREKIQEDDSEWARWKYTERQGVVPEYLVPVADQSLCVWYSPWQHQKEGNPLVPLLQEIRAQYSAWQEVKARADENLRRATLGALTLLERTIDGAISLGAVAASALLPGAGSPRSFRVFSGATREISEMWDREQPPLSRKTDGQRFQLLFEDTVETLLATNADNGGSVGRLIVFVDDLDRCEERAIVELLEAIKLYLGCRRCIFVLGLDENAVGDALARCWPGRSEDANREYLEKLFQAMLPLPPARLDHVKQFVSRQFLQHDLKPGPACSAMVAEILEPNPRRIKNFVNSVCALWPLFQPAQPEDPDGAAIFAKRFLLLAYLRTFHKPVWRLLERQPWSLRFLTQILAGGDAGSILKTEHYDPNDQRLLRELFHRSFGHVRPDHNKEAKSDAHGHFSLEKAVDLFQTRIDRKRSDEIFIRHYNQVFAVEHELPLELLCFPVESP